MNTRVARFVSAAGLLSLSACGQEEGTPPPPRGFGEVPTDPASPSGSSPSARVVGRTTPHERREAHLPPQAAPPRAATSEENPSLAPSAATEKGEDKPKRDLSEEVRQLAGDPGSCFGTGAEMPPSVAIPIEVTISGQGVVTRVEVGGSVPEDARRCLRRRIGQGRIRTPVPEDAPRKIRSLLSLKRKPV